jgi:hypothetical protein
VRRPGITGPLLDRAVDYRNRDYIRITYIVNKPAGTAEPIAASDRPQ